MVRQKRGHTEGVGNPNGQGSNQQLYGKIQSESSNTPKPASCGNVQHPKLGQKAIKEAPSEPHKGYNLANARMVPRWG